MSPEAQREIVKLLGGLADESFHEFDDTGDVIRFAVSNAERFRSPGKKARAGIDPANFPPLLELDQLRAVFLEAQPLDDASYASLPRLRNLEDVRIRQPLAGVGATLGLVRMLDLLGPVTSVEFDADPGLGGALPAGMEAQPHLERVTLDGGFAGPTMLAYLAGSPILEHLRLTRTAATNRDLAALVDALPVLRTVMLSPASGGALDGSGLAAFRGHPMLAAFFFRGEWPGLKFEGGLEVLTEVPDLEFVDFGAVAAGADDDLVARFRAVRPDVTVRVAGRVLPGNAGERVWDPEAEDRWGLAVRNVSGTGKTV